MRSLKAAIAALLFLILRIVLMLRREPDIDEIFSVWIAHKDLGAMFRTLLLDSGPPLYYLILHFLLAHTVAVARILSLVFAAATLVITARAATRASAFTAVMLIAVYPQHVFFSVEGRAYALCALAVGAAVHCLDRWSDTDERRWLAGGAAALLIAAYSHYYGVLFFPLPFVLALLTKRWNAIRDSLVASAALALLFVPGFMLIAAQPAEAVSWMRVANTLQRVLLVAGSFLRIGFDGRVSLAWLRILSAVLLIAALLKTAASARATRFFVAIAIPIVASIAIAAAGRTAYFPIRFESVLTVPVVLWFMFAAGEWPRAVRNGILCAAFATGAIASCLMIAGTAPEQRDQRQLAQFARHNVMATTPLVASGLSYLELYGQLDKAWRPPLIPFPQTYDVHPGFRASHADVTRDLPRLRAIGRPFIWFGEIDSEEARAIRSTFGGTIIVRSGGSAAVAVDPRTATIRVPAL